MKTNTNEKRMADLAATKRQWIGVIRVSNISFATFYYQEVCSFNLFLMQFWLSFFPAFSPLAAAARYQRKNIKGCLQSAPTAANYRKWNRNGVSSHVLSSHLIISLQKWPKNDKTLQVNWTLLPKLLMRPEQQHPSSGLCVSRFKRHLNLCGQVQSLTHLSLSLSR